MQFFNKYMNSKMNSPVENKYLLGEIFSGIFNAIGADRQAGAEEQIARENLEYQRERNEIEDARYADETTYNRAFAEDERDYNRALQQQIFEREDTALERQANQLSKLGINPLTQQMNGLESGSVVSGAAAPTASDKGGQALHNDYKPTEAFNNLMTPILSFANSLNNLQTGGFQRDLLREQADNQRLVNEEQKLINADLERKLNTEQEQREEDLRHSKTNNPNIEKDTKATANRNEREDVFQSEYGVTDNTPKEIRWATDTAKQAERASNYVNDKVGDLSKSATKVLVDKTKKAFDAYDKATKKASDWLFDKYNSAKNWFKKHTASPEQVRDMYGF